MQHRYAVFQHGGPIYGIGKTERSALDASLDWAAIDEDAVTEYVAGQAVEGGMYIAPISDLLAYEVEESGGHVPYEILDGWLVDPNEV